ncbi:MAG: LPS export ABC transporter permease LptF [Candidatus Tectimicrobiota bacterium]
MPIIDRYLLRELVPAFFLVTVVTTLVLFMDKLLWITTLVLRNHLDWLTSMRLLCYTVPTVSGLTFPIAFLLACTLTFNRLAMDSEYIVLKASGVSLYRLLTPVSVAGLLMYGLASVVLMYVSPWGFHGLQKLFFEIAQSRAYYHLQTHEFNDTFKGLVLYIERIDPEKRRFEGVFIADTRSNVSQIITAKSGEVLTQAETLRVTLHLEDGLIHRYGAPYKRYDLVRFGRYDVHLDLDTRLARQARDEARPREMFPEQIRAEIARQQGLGNDTRGLELFWHKLFALPFACIIFAGLGPALGIVQPKAGRSAGYVVGLGVIFVYYLFLTASDALAEDTLFCPPVVAAWLPNLCMGAVTLVLLRRTSRDAPPLDFGWLPRYVWHRLRGWRTAPVSQGQSDVVALGEPDAAEKEPGGRSR